MTRLLLALTLSFVAYLVAVELSLRWLGNDDEDEPGGGITFAGGGA